MSPIEATPASEAKPSAEDLAAHDFQILMPQFRKAMDKVAGRKLKEVMEALTAYPLEDNGGKMFSYTEQQELYLLGQKLFDCKFVIMKEIFNLSKEQLNGLIKKMAAEGHLGEVKNENIQGGLSDSGQGEVRSDEASAPPVCSS